MFLPTVKTSKFLVFTQSKLYIALIVFSIFSTLLINMDELYALHSSISCSYNDQNLNNNNNNNIITGLMGHDLISSDHQQHGSTQEAVGTTEVIITGPVEEEEHMSYVIKSRIINHPLYPNLVSAYIQCRKVGETPDMVSFLEEIGSKESSFTTCDRIAEIGVDPQLDDFMESYCKVLHRLREDISKPFDEASSFFNHMESQLSSLCRQNLSPIATTSHDEATRHSNETLSCGDAVSESQESSAAPQGDTDLKRKLLNKYSGYLTSLRKEFTKTRKKGKLPKDARVTLMDWWNAHCRWPYPTTEEKTKLSEVTGLDRNQINNWFINQRKRHWRPSDDLRLALMQTVNGRITESPCFDAPGGGTNSIDT